MSKTSETKNKILKLLTRKNMRLVDIYPKLNLTSTTVIQHLKELEDMDLITKVSDPHFKNVKYYTLAKKGAAETDEYIFNAKENGRRQGLIALPVIIVALFGLLLFFLLQSQGQGSKQNQGMLELIIMDPSNVPLGTNNLTVSYTSVYVHVNETGNSSWVKMSSGGTINLMPVTNSSTLIGHVQLPPNAFIDAARFNISSAAITINNVSYPVILSDNKISVYVKNMHVQHNGNMGMLLAFSPTIQMVHNSSSTTFVMKYSVKVMMI